ncbi:hypothetical protein [Helicobacter trogontum]|uniref:Uncharacterized protein n=1 Tax=Helicobacter trogontum TaxID=50960 RepID=A0A4U8S9G5_9HELI|nr:hypothetical protein [Helicobacter trogontum]TLD82566.1 hypothetical protein LS81_007385 [Helicobacter trogontum]
MKIKIKKSIWSSTSKTKEIVLQRKKIKRIFKRKNRGQIFRTHRARPPKSPYAKCPKYKITLPENMTFPTSIKEIDDFIQNCQQATNEKCKINIKLNIIKEIDNTTILILTANIKNIFKTLHRNKKAIPSQDIDERLTLIGFWEALCVNPPKINNSVDYLKITKLQDSKINDNSFHSDIINFFAKQHHLEQYKDSLFDAVYEACVNSFEHAYSEDDVNKSIWFLGSYDKNKKELEFIFYDIGMGIFKSLESNKTKLQKTFTRFKKMHGKKETLKKLCTTDLSRYSNDKSKKGRGNGMMAFTAFVNNVSKERRAILEVVAENLLYSSYNDETIMIARPIKGTLVRWVVEYDEEYYI